MNKKAPNDLIRKWKKDHRLESVMKELGETFKEDDPQAWRGIATPGLIVDTEKQVFTLTRGGQVINGDLYDWLSKVKKYPFSAPVGKPSISRLLELRKPDPKQSKPAQGIKVHRTKRAAMPVMDAGQLMKISNVHESPITGAISYAVDYRFDLMDDLQKRAFDLAGSWAVKRMGKTREQLLDALMQFPSRFKSIVDFSIKECASCKTRFNWQQAGTVAFAQEEDRTITVYIDNDNAETGETDYIYCDAEFVICEHCLRSKYAPRYKALSLCYQSANRLAEEIEETRKQHESEAARLADIEREREEQIWISKMYSDSAAAAERV